MKMLLVACILVPALSFAQQPPNCAEGGFVISPDETIWVCKGLGLSPEQVQTGGGGASWGSITGTLADQTDLQTALDGKQAAGSYLAPNGNGGSLTGLTKSQVGLANVENTADANKNVNSAATLTTPRTINGTSFNGSANITVTAAPSGLAGGDLAGTYPNPTIKTSVSLTTPVIGAATGTSLALSGDTTTTGGKVGYATGAGGTVTQATNKATAVTLSKQCGAITLACLLGEWWSQRGNRR